MSVRYHVLIVIDLASPRVEIGGIACEPSVAWMKQAVRNLIDAEEGFLRKAQQGFCLGDLAFHVILIVFSEVLLVCEKYHTEDTYNLDSNAD